MWMSSARLVVGVGMLLTTKRAEDIHIGVTSRFL
jgi:hypothetical protein